MIQLSPAEAAHMSNSRAETAEPGCAVKSCPTVEAVTVEPGEAMEATGAKSEAGEPAEGVAVAIIRPVVVTRRALGIVAAARADTAVTRGERVSGWADRNWSGGARRRSTQHRRGRKRGCRARWVRRRYRNDPLRGPRWAPPTQRRRRECRSATPRKPASAVGPWAQMTASPRVESGVWWTRAWGNYNASPAPSREQRLAA